MDIAPFVKRLAEFEYELGQTIAASVKMNWSKEIVNALPKQSQISLFVVLSNAF